MNYHESSHRQRWIFTAAQLVGISAVTSSFCTAQTSGVPLLQLDIRKALRAKSIATIAKVVAMLLRLENLRTVWD